MNFTLNVSAARATAADSARKAAATVLSAAIALTGCATSSKDITSSYVSPLQYQAYDCAQITAEVQRVQARANEIAGSLDQAASSDKALVGVGMILFWPALFTLGGSKPQQAEFARLKGESDALQRAAIDKRCSGMVTAPSAPSAPAAPAAPAAAATPPTALPSAPAVSALRRN